MQNHSNLSSDISSSNFQSGFFEEEKEPKSPSERGNFENEINQGIF